MQKTWGNWLFTNTFKKKNMSFIQSYYMTELVLLLKKTVVLSYLKIHFDFCFAREKKTLVSYWPHMFWNEGFISAVKMWITNILMHAFQAVWRVWFGAFLVYMNLAHTVCSFTVQWKGWLVILFCFKELICFFGGKKEPTGALLHNTWWIIPTDGIICTNIEQHEVIPLSINS